MFREGIWLLSLISEPINQEAAQVSSKTGPGPGLLLPEAPLAPPSPSTPPHRHFLFSALALLPFVLLSPALSV